MKTIKPQRELHYRMHQQSPQCFRVWASDWGPDQFDIVPLVDLTVIRSVMQRFGIPVVCKDNDDE